MTLAEQSKIHKENNSLGVWLSIGLLAVVLIVWGFSLQNINVEDISNLGLFTALPYSFFIAFGVLAISFFLLISQKQESFGALFLHVLVLILIIHGTLAVVYDVPRYPWTYKVSGMVSHVSQYGEIDASFGPYQYWPSFFIIFGFLDALLDVGLPIVYAGWAQFVFNSLFLVGLLFLFRNLTDQWRRVWIAVWLFFLSNWIGQDCFVPQALNYFLYLIFFGITIRWFVKERQIRIFKKFTGFFRRFFPPPLEENKHKTELKESQRLGAFIILLLLYFFIVSGHQLTPFMIIAGIIFIILFIGHRSKTIPITLAVILGTWILYAAWEYVTLNAHLFQKILKIYENIYDSLFLRYNFQDVPQKHWSMLIAGYFQTGFIWLLAFLGGIRRRRKGYYDRIAIFLAFSPFLLLIIFTYGGEILYRIHYFSLPWIAYLAAAIIYSDPIKKFRKYIEGIGYTVISVILFVGLVFSFYGNEIIYFISEKEIDVINFFYEEAEPGSLLYTPLSFTPSKFTADFHLFEHQWIISSNEFHLKKFTEYEILEILEFLANEKYPEAYFLVTKSQLNYVDIYNITPEGTLILLTQDLLATNQVEIVEATSDAILFKYIGEQGD